MDVCLYARERLGNFETEVEIEIETEIEMECECKIEIETETEIEIWFEFESGIENETAMGQTSASQKRRGNHPGGGPFQLILPESMARGSL